MTLGNNVESWNLAIGASLILIIGVVGFEFSTPKPTTRDVDKQVVRDKRELTTKVLTSKKLYNQAQDLQSSYTWKIERDKVGPEILTDLTQLATKHSVTVSNFRPSKTSQVGPLTVLSYETNASGSFLKISEFMRALEEPQNLVIVQSVQISNSDGNSDDVVVNLGLLAAVASDQSKETKKA